MLLFAELEQPTGFLYRERAILSYYYPQVSLSGRESIFMIHYLLSSLMEYRISVVITEFRHKFTRRL